MKLRFIVFSVFAFIGIALLWKIKMDPQGKEMEIRGDTPPKGGFSSVSFPDPLEKIMVQTSSLSWKALERSSRPFPAFEQTELFRRLRPLKVLASREVMHGQRRIMEHILETSGKYSHITLVQSFSIAALGQEAPLQEIAYVADHVLIQSKAGGERDRLRARLATQGFLAVPVGLTEVLRVRLAKAELDGVGQMLTKLQAVAPEAVAEPDYLVFPADVLDQWQEIESLPRVDPDRQDWVKSELPSPAGSSAVAVNGETILRQQQMEYLASVPAGARVIGFDPPFFRAVNVATADISYSPSILEQNFILSVPGQHMYIQPALYTFSPNNGSRYARFIPIQAGFTLTHKDGLPFAIYAVDLAEPAGSVTFKGTKSNGTTVLQTFTLDGISDGTGPQADFQTFTFNSNFLDLVKVEVTETPSFYMDNIVVAPNGEETPLPPPPVAPLVYDITWDGEPHQINQPTVLSGPYAPTSMNFGTQYVRQAIGPLTNRALELQGDAGQMYDQFRLDLGYGSSSYTMDFDLAMPIPRLLAVIYDGPGPFYRLDFNSNGTVTLMEHTGSTINSTTSATMTFDPAQITHVRVQIDFVGQFFKVFFNGTEALNHSLLPGMNEVKAARFSLSDSDHNGLVGLDNVKLWAPIPPASPINVPEARVIPVSVTFPEFSMGGGIIRSLRIFNEGTANLTVSNVISSNPSEFQVSEPASQAILPGGFADIEVTFFPNGPGNRTGTIQLATNDSDEGLISVPVHGTGYATPIAQITPSHLYVTMLRGTIGMQSFTISNSGGSPLTWSFQSFLNPTLPSPVFTNDPLSSQQWALRAPTSSSGGIDAGRAWHSTTGAALVKVAVIDSGIAATHPDLAENLWINNAEIPGNGLDDDSNGFVDDRSGWNFYADTNNPADGAGHGTHVSGTIAARGNNLMGISGMAWQASLLPIKFLSDQGSGSTSDAIQAIDYARICGARLINASWGGGGNSALLQSAIQNFIIQRDGIFVAAAGNSYANTDQFPHYPACYPLDGILSVAATDDTDTLAFFSNYGTNSVDLAAPGTAILSTLPNASYGVGSGTSMAAPHVTGTLALLLGYRASYTGAEMRRLILDGLDIRPALIGKLAREGRLNANSTLSPAVVYWIMPQLMSGTVAAGASTSVPLHLDAGQLAPGRYFQNLVLRTNDPARTSISLPVDLTVQSPTAYGSWSQNYFAGAAGMLFNESADSLWGASADADSDGMANLLEYLTGTDPLDGQDTNAPTFTIQGGQAIFFFETENTATGISYQPEWSNTLDANSWSSDGLTITLDAELPGKKRWKVSFTNPLSAPARAFFRLKAMQED
jgi:subtilisin family serine protease